MNAKENYGFINVNVGKIDYFNYTQTYFNFVFSMHKLPCNLKLYLRTYILSKAAPLSIIFMIIFHLNVNEELKFYFYINFK